MTAFKHTFGKFAFALCSVIGATVANADLIIDKSDYDASITDTPAASLSTFFPDPNPLNNGLVPAGAAIADDFSLNGVTNISKISFWTLTNINAGLFSDNISVAIYSNEPNVMFDSPIWAAGGGLGQAASMMSMVVDSFNGLDIVKHELDVTGLELNAGSFLLHVGGADGNGFQPSPFPFPVGNPIGWLASSAVDMMSPQGIQFDANGVGLINPLGKEVEFAFTIEGTVVEASAPATLALISLSVAGLLLRRKVS